MYCSSLDDFVCVCMLQREIYDFFFQIIKKKDQNQAPLEFIMGSGLKNVNRCHSLNWIMQAIFEKFHLHHTCRLSDNVFGT